MCVCVFVHGYMFQGKVESAQSIIYCSDFGQVAPLNFLDLSCLICEMGIWPLPGAVSESLHAQAAWVMSPPTAMGLQILLPCSLFWATPVSPSSPISANKGWFENARTSFQELLGIRYSVLLDHKMTGQWFSYT